MNDELRRVGMECFVTCFDDFEREANGQSERSETIRSMFERGGADTQNSAETKASNGVRIIRGGKAIGALIHVSQAENVPDGVRARAIELLDRLRSLSTS